MFLKIFLGYWYFFFRELSFQCIGPFIDSKSLSTAPPFAGGINKLFKTYIRPNFSFFIYTWYKEAVGLFAPIHCFSCPLIMCEIFMYPITSDYIAQ